MIQAINAKKVGWTAGVNENFMDAKVGDVCE
jgi:hypothetical protein